MKLPHLESQVYSYAVIRGKGASAEVLHPCYSGYSAIEWIRDNTPTGDVRIIRRRKRSTEFVNVPYTLERKDYETYYPDGEKKITLRMLARLDGMRIYVSSGLIGILATLEEYDDNGEPRWRISQGRSHLGSFNRKEIAYIQTYGNEINGIRIR